jgi:hypothetical protein
MSKLNNKGWGVATFVILLCLLLIGLLISAKLINDIGGSLPLSKDMTKVDK